MDIVERSDVVEIVKEYSCLLLRVYGREKVDLERLKWAVKCLLSYCYRFV